MIVFRGPEYHGVPLEDVRATLRPFWVLKHEQLQLLANKLEFCLAIARFSYTWQRAAFDWSAIVGCVRVVHYASFWMLFANPQAGSSTAFP